MAPAGHEPGGSSCNARQFENEAHRADSCIVRQEGWILSIIALGTAGGLGYAAFSGLGSSTYAHFTAAPSQCGDCQAASPSASVEAPSTVPETGNAESATSAPGEYQRSKISDLPEPAKGVLNFTPADDPDQTNSKSIFERVADDCGLDDFVGSDDFPGTIVVSPPREHHWVRVTWKVGSAGALVARRFQTQRSFSKFPPTSSTSVTLTE